MSRGAKGLLDYISLLLTSKDPKAMEKTKDMPSPQTTEGRGERGKEGKEY